MSDLTTEQEEVQRSEFGSGVVVCLAKFSEHLSNRMYVRLTSAIWWQEANEQARQAQVVEAARHPQGDAARRVAEARSVFMGVRENPEQEISSAIEMWMNGASDHMYDLDREVAPPSLIALADLTLAVGHGFTNQLWTKETVSEILRLWQAACIEVDQKLGLDPDWGEW